MFRPAVYLCALQMLDIATTRLALLGGGVEANPVVAAILVGYGWGGFVVVKVAAIAVVVGAAYFIRGLGFDRLGLGLLFVGCVLSVGVVGWNSFVIMVQV